MTSIKKAGVILVVRDFLVAAGMAVNVDDSPDNPDAPTLETGPFRIGFDEEHDEFVVDNVETDVQKVVELNLDSAVNAIGVGIFDAIADLVAER